MICTAQARRPIWPPGSGEASSEREEFSDKMNGQRALHSHRYEDAGGCTAPAVRLYLLSFILGILLLCVQGGRFYPRSAPCYEKVRKNPKFSVFFTIFRQEGGMRPQSVL